MYMGFNACQKWEFKIVEYISWVWTIPALVIIIKQKRRRMKMIGFKTFLYFLFVLHLELFDILKYLY